MGIEWCLSSKVIGLPEKILENAKAELWVTALESVLESHYSDLETPPSKLTGLLLPEGREVDEGLLCGKPLVTDWPIQELTTLVF